MTFEFDLEVRPQFDLPQWKGLQIEKPTREFIQVRRLLAGPDFAVGDGADVAFFRMPPIRHRLNELGMHVVNQALHVFAFRRSHFARRASRILEFARLHGNRVRFAHFNSSP